MSLFPNSALFIVDFFVLLFSFKRPKIADMGRRDDQLFICLIETICSGVFPILKKCIETRYELLCLIVNLY